MLTNSPDRVLECLEKQEQLNWYIYKIKAKMDILKISQRDLAKYCNISRSVITELLTEQDYFGLPWKDFEYKWMVLRLKLSRLESDIEEYSMQRIHTAANEEYILNKYKQSKAYNLKKSPNDDNH